MAGERVYTRLPPESTGDRLQVRHALIVPYTSLVAAKIPAIGAELTGDSSLTMGVVGKIIQTSATAGIMYLTPSHGDEESSFSIGENLLNSNSETVATVDAAGTISDLYTNASTLVSHDNPLVGQKVDEKGSAQVTYPLGSPNFDAFSRMRVSEISLVGEYIFRYDEKPSLFTRLSGSGGDETYDATQGNIVFSLPITSGAFVSKTSDLYHRYDAGKSQLITMTNVVGDSGKDNVIRRWGYFDENDGLFFMLSGSDFGVVVRDSTSGVVVDTFISQSAFNVDRVDGSKNILNPSNQNFDVSKNTIYSIDLQWLGAGQVRFGATINGEIVVFHKESHSNFLSRPYMRSASRPIRWEQENLNTSVSTSEMRSSCAVVYQEGKFEPVLDFVTTAVNTVLETTDEVYLFSIRPSLTLNGRDNHVIGLLEQIEVAAISGSAESFVETSIYKNPVLTGDSFAAVSSVSAFEVDTSGSPTSSGTKVDSFYAKGLVKEDLGNKQCYAGPNRIVNSADLSTQPIWAVYGRNMIADATTDLTVRLTWKEIQD